MEQCPNCAVFLTRGASCAICGYPNDPTRPSRLAELEEYLARLRRGDRGADAQELIGLAKRFALQWGSPELKPGNRRLHLQDASGPALAVQEASGSELYLVVVLGEVPWSNGLVHFFSIEEKEGAPPATRVRLRKEAVATLDGRDNLVCQSAGQLQVVKRAASIKREEAPPAGPPSVATPPIEIPVPPALIPRRPAVIVAAAVLAAVLATLSAVWIARTGKDKEFPEPPPPPYSPPGVGSLEVRANCPALGNLDGLILPESKKQRSFVLRWTNQPARAHRLKVTCDGFEDHTENVSLKEGEPTMLPVELRRR